ncbi:MAG: arginine--tRNA ligase [Cyclobacteriaceae bacterium]
MTLIEDKLSNALQKGLSSIFSTEVESSRISFQSTKKEFAGSYTFVTFPFAKQLKQAPPKIAEQLGEYLQQEVDEVAGFNVVQGFLNIELSASYWIEQFNSILKKDSFDGEKKPLKVMVEFSSPNTNKPLHLGHLRNNFLGASLSNILSAYGYEVTKANLVNDRGIHICKSMVAYQHFGNGTTPTSTDTKGDHFVGQYYVKFDQEYKKEMKQLVADGKTQEEAEKQAPLLVEAQQMLKKWESGDTEITTLWKQMNAWVYEGFDATYKQTGITFDKYYYESNTYLLGKDLVKEGLENGAFYQKEDHSVWADLSSDGLDEKIVQRGDGTSVYMTQDMGTADLKYQDFGVDKSIYVVGDEQDYHFKVLQLILKKLNKPYADGIYHMSYGMVDLPSGKMKSREGTVVDADDLVNQMINTAKQRTQELGKIDTLSETEAEELYTTLALGALKYFLLKVEPRKRMLFNPEESIDFQGNTGPFIQYTYARISAIVRKAEQINIPVNGSVSLSTPAHELELELIEKISQYSKKLEEAALNYSPSVIANYVYELAKTYNRFYSEVPVFTEDNQEIVALRVTLSKQVSELIACCMNLLGVIVPERM